MKRTLLIALAVLATIFSSVCAAELPADKSERTYKNAIDFCPVTPMVGIWGIQYSRLLGPKDHLMLGFAYMNIKYDSGRSHAPTFIIGDKHYFWKGLHLEYELMPSYNAYWEFHEKKYYKGPELWNEFRPGYTIDFSVADVPLYIDLQFAAGFALYGGNKPDSFKRQVKKEPLFLSPLFFLGWRF
jgi:hypothetical protein